VRLSDLYSLPFTLYPFLPFAFTLYPPGFPLCAARQAMIKLSALHQLKQVQAGQDARGERLKGVAAGSKLAAGAADRPARAASPVDV
jgi:hypothetical protein